MRTATIAQRTAAILRELGPLTARDIIEQWTTRYRTVPASSEMGQALRCHPWFSREWIKQQNNTPGNGNYTVALYSLSEAGQEAVDYQF